MSDDILYAVEEGVATVTLNRPERRNAFTLEMVDEWARVLRAAGADTQVGAIVLTGAGAGFCAGGDLDMLGGLNAAPLSHKRFLTDRVHHVALAVADLDKPLIAAINGDAVGAGLDMALMCDMRFAAESARMSEGYIRVGLVPGDGGCYYLPRLVGIAKALELLLSGDFVDAAEALRIGLVNRVYDDGSLLQETQRFARRLAAQSPVPMRMIKRAAYQSQDTDLRTSLDLISSHMAVVMATSDAAEAMAAFRERRDPTFSER